MEHNGAFPSTRWTKVGRAGASDSAARLQALTELLPLYREPMIAHMVRARRLRPELAEEVVHDFIAEKLLDTTLWEKADPKRGRFRTLICVSLDRFYISRWIRKRRLAQIPDEDAIDRLPAGQPAPSAAFDRQWARTLLHEAVEAMRLDCQDRGKAAVWAIFNARVLAPVVNGDEPVDYDTLAREHGLPSITRAANLLVTAKRTFRRHLYALLRRQSESDAEVEGEIADLEEILAAGGAECAP